jgi:hypothetical protein
LEREGLKFSIKKLKRQVLPGIFEIKGSQNHQKFSIKKLKRQVLPGIFEIKGSQNHQY